MTKPEPMEKQTGHPSDAPGHGMREKRADYERGEKVSIAAIFGNVLLSALKLAAGLLGRSEAMVSDAMHSLSDIISTLVVLVGIRIAKKPVDKDHPYGHGKVEPIAATFVGITLVVAAILIVKSIVESILLHSFATPTFLALAAALVSIVVKEFMYRITYAAGKRINSEAIVADAWHHRSDAFSSMGTFVGIGGSMIGKWLGIGFMEYLDPLAGVVVACFIFKVAYDIIKHALKGLMDTSPDEAKIQAICDVAASTEGIISVRDVKGRYIGPYLHVDMEIEVAPDITVEAGHDVAAQVRVDVISAIEDVNEVLIHVEPSKKI